MPPRGALTWPSSEVPVPNAITGTRCAAHSRTTSCTSSVVCGKTTASGGWFSIQVVVWPCCSRTACEVTSRLPNRAASAAMTVSAALRSRWLRCHCLDERHGRSLCCVPLLQRNVAARACAGQAAGDSRPCAPRRDNPLTVAFTPIRRIGSTASIADPAFSAPFVSSPMRVEPGWIDYNGHLNMAYYNVLFDRAVDEVYELLGCGLAYVEASRHSCFTAEVHVRYLRELHAGDPVRVTFQLLGFDAKRLHYFEAAFSCRGRLAVGHVREHGAARRHDGEEDRRFPAARSSRSSRA